MIKELELWQFILERLRRNEPVMLLVVAKSSGSSPGRAGYKMAVAADGQLCGSIGGGIMEIALVEEAKAEISPAANGVVSKLIEQVHQKNSPSASGMICSGRQTVILHLIKPDPVLIAEIEAFIEDDNAMTLTLTPNRLAIRPDAAETGASTAFDQLSETEFQYSERLGYTNELYIIGGGHCSLALSDLMSKLDFRITVLDDRPDLNTVSKNHFAHHIDIIGGYEAVVEQIGDGPNTYVVVMTVGYQSDAAVIRSLIDKPLRYVGVLGSKAKMATLLRDLEREGFSREQLSRLHTPIGVPINSRTPEEIAVSIAAEIIAIKNA
ncbi:MAG: XdhC family protein [Pyrinomonadaceae bacterium]